MPKQITNEDLAVMIKNGFDTTTVEFASVRDDFDQLKTGLARVETKVDKALHVEYVNLEVRVKRIENKLELKPINEPSSI